MPKDAKLPDDATTTSNNDSSKQTNILSSDISKKEIDNSKIQNINDEAQSVGEKIKRKEIKE